MMASFFTCIGQSWKKSCRWFGLLLSLTSLYAPNSSSTLVVHNICFSVCGMLGCGLVLLEAPSDPCGVVVDNSKLLCAAQIQS